MIDVKDPMIIEKLKTKENMNFFWPEIDSFYTDGQITFNDDKYIEKRENEQNDQHLAILIRNDWVEQFIIYINLNNVPLNSKIGKSHFETNSFLTDKNPTLIEYAAFFGSIQIFKFLQMEKVELTGSLWIYAIHSDNAELIHILEENKIEPEDNTYKTCIIESIKCHHNEFARYLIDKYGQNNNYFGECWKYYNYMIIPNDQNSYSSCRFSVKKLYNYIQVNPEFINLLYTSSYLDINLKEKGKTVLLMAIKDINIKIIKLIASNPKTDLNIKFKEKGVESTVLTFAIKKGNLEIIQILLSSPQIDPNIKLNTKYNSEINALTMSIEDNNIPIVNLLLSNNKTDPNIKLNIRGKESNALSMSIE
ncbi:hypothetical protein M9Y10_042617 [Tritrichomonas musculus]|uniref:DUF3447 domain-containing protein n=1 Tax=Tritrichomonas musculus TaxID=1915356 RepID=A0ABR2JXD9_9EUKA